MDNLGVKERTATRRPLGSKKDVSLLIPLFAAVLVPFVIFARLARHYHRVGGFTWDEPILHAIHERATPAGDAVAVWLAHAGGKETTLPLAIAVTCVLLVQKKRRAAWYYVLATGGSALLNLAAKEFFERRRPFLWESPTPKFSYSFPSSHAMGSMAVFAAIAVLLWPTRWRWIVVVGAGIFVFLVGVSRLYLGVHYPSDVLAGWCASLAWVVGLRLLFEHTAKDRRRWMT
jgi:undecaprenyl-diphosphatase